MSGKNSIRLFPNFDASISRHSPKLYPPPPDGNCHSRPGSRPAAIFRQTAEPRRQTVKPFYQLAELFRQTAGQRCQLAEQFCQTAARFRRLAESICQLAESFCQAAFPAKSASFQHG
jgi:hypothetical protein